MASAGSPRRAVCRGSRRSPAAACEQRRARPGQHAVRDGARWKRHRALPALELDPNAAPDTGRLTEELALPTAGAQPFLITSGTDGNVWFTERGQPMIGAIFMPTHCLYGKVTLADLATPITPAATMTLSPASGAHLTTTTDAAGNYNFCGLAAGSYVVTPALASRSFAPSSLPVTIVLSNVIDVDFVAQ